MTDPRIYTAPAPLAPGKTPGKWTASGNVKLPEPGMQPKGSIWRVAEPEHGFPANTYLRADYPTVPVVVEPTPTPAPTPAPVLTLVNGEAFARIGETVFGFNAYGGLGTLGTAPIEFRTAGEKFARKGFFIGGKDLIIPGAPIDALTVAYSVDGERVVIANQGLNLSANGVLGEWTASGVWSGQMGALSIVRAYELNATGLRVTYTVTNTSGDTLNDVVVMITQDIDNGDTGGAGVTTNRIAARGSVTALLSSGKAYTLSTDDDRFSGAVSPTVVGRGYVFMQPDAVSPQAVGYSAKADNAVILRGTIGAMAATASTSFVVKMGLS